MEGYGMSKNTETKGHRIKRSVLPEVETLIAIQMTPHAVCHLTHKDAKGHHLQLDADAGGVVRFHARAFRCSESVELQLECVDADGRSSTHILELHAEARPSPPEGAVVEDTAAVHGTVVPALEGDPLALTNEELIARGYPPRPDPCLTPSRYARWLGRVSQPFTRVEPTMTPHPEVRFTTERSHRTLPLNLESPTLPLPPPMAIAMAFNSTSSNWSGAFLTNPVAQFFLVEADWPVPVVFRSPAGGIYSAAAEWIGLDNSSTDLYQSGTDSEVFTIPLIPFWSFTNYWMWIESLPFAPFGLPNFPLSPGDKISMDIFVADENGNTSFRNGTSGGLTPADNSVWFMIYNLTKGLSFWGTLPTAPQNGSTGFTGSTAEFILERPTVNNSLVPLAQFAPAVMTSCWYGDAQYGDRLFRLGANGSSPFDGTLTYLNIVDAAKTVLALSYSLPDPSSPRGYEVNWLWVNSL
jgi:hypothetical protein